MSLFLNKKIPSSPALLKGAQKRSGFTLIEILIAVAILSIVLAALYSTFFLAHKAIDGMEESMVKLQESRRALDILKCELDSSYLSSTDEHTFFKIADRDIFGKGASQLEFTTFSTLRPGLSKISYYVEEKDGELNLLKKVESPYVTGETEGIAIIEGLEAFTIEAKYGDDTWVRTWDSEMNGREPPEIRISFSMLIKGKQVTLSDVSKPKIGGSI
jgi:general secretion pathway protein J